MFEIEKGTLKYLVFYTGKTVLVKLISSPDYTTLLLLQTIRDNLAMLATYHLKNAHVDYKKGFLKQYFSKRGWQIKIYRSQLSENNLGDMRIS